ncbi:TPA: lipopolysaccharide biosynthesis protein [Vibrio vulnificus]|nr:lipopolysaccharide biosynthesis protein [Vibrio vulnificus]HAS8445446.1 lipopolysaccharide biosynthesis protein [Vibrio vulnificus]HAS8454901.1 lipopolysaccharide biosynthesis protein [Vibrio vulnificus]HDY7725112.1 lipopolysaccharide biosynthesis protein [Vibrio vulnificus]
MSKLRLYEAVIKSVSGKLSTYVVQTASLIITARLFGPQEFGIIASIQVFVIFFQMLADVGIGPAIINEDNIEPKKRDGIYSVTVIIGVFLAALFYAFTFLLNDFYGDYNYQDVGLLISFSVLFSALGILPVTSLNKDLKFIQLAIIEVVSELLSLSVIFYLYIENYGVIALAARAPTQSFFKTSLTWFFSKHTTLGRPKIGRELHHIKAIASFSIYQFGFNFVNYFSKNMDNVLVGKYIGMESLGVYDRAYQLMRYPLMLTTFAMTPAIQPVLTKIKKDTSRVSLEHSKLCRRLLLISIPISFFLYTNTTSIIGLIFGEKWLEISDVVKVFCFIIPIQTIVAVSGSFFQVMNRTKVLFKYGIISAAINLTAISYGIFLGDVKSVATMVVISYALCCVLNKYMLISSCFDDSVREFVVGLFNIWIIAPPLVLYSYLNMLIEPYYIGGDFLNLTFSVIVFFSCFTLFFKPLVRCVKC